MATRDQIGLRIREAREELGLSQGEFGSLLSRRRAHAAISELERGKVRLDAEELVEIAAILNKDLAYFYAAPVAPTIVYRRGDRGLGDEQQRETNKAIDAFKQYAREQAKLKAEREDR